MPDVYCNTCGWEGATNELDGVRCPECGEAKEIEDYHKDNTPIWAYYDDYNWNKP